MAKNGLLFVANLRKNINNKTVRVKTVHLKKFQKF